ncbi:DUF2029 domain-containing protein [Alloacidobacterium dinghuense]|uniref:DUF2029 domain-containing protein n=1 Tax=Alloacidobacterium dinghuense TaxID=2763107 RepID=A0A7G8BI83_9BACT|nr:glycosyltransferase family 87 protein [Alloacidobacterium dinghuense]QNI32253.1 DUF2029 domain-containing protein [Alloacidobacterium dinghuense]
MKTIRTTPFITCVALLIALLPCVAPRLRHPLPAMKWGDFNVYFSGAVLVHEGLGSQLYTGADDGTDPQKKPARPGAPIDRAARSQGITGIDYYLYPPLLADMLVPLTYVGLRTAAHIWIVINLGLLLATAICLASVIRVRLVGLWTGLLLVGVICFSPVVDCISYGQITIFLLFLWALGTALYAKGYTTSSGIIFALAAAIKLTPAIVLIPFIVWRNWKWIISFLASFSAFTAATLYINAPSTLILYFRRITPAMSRSIPQIPNLSISSSTQLMIAALRGIPIFPDPAVLPAKVVLAGKTVSLLLTLALIFTIARLGQNLAMKSQIVVLALLALASPLLSPVSWLHAYAIAFVAFAVLWSEALRSRFSIPYLSLLTFASITVGSYAWLAMLLKVAHLRHDILTASLGLTQLIALCALVFYRLTGIGKKMQTPAIGEIAI